MKVYGLHRWSAVALAVFPAFTHSDTIDGAASSKSTRVIFRSPDDSVYIVTTELPCDGFAAFMGFEYTKFRTKT